MVGEWKLVHRTGDTRERVVFAWWPRTQYHDEVRDGRRYSRWVWLQRVRLIEEYAGGYECVWLTTNVEPV